MKKNKNRIKYFILFSLIISIFLIFNCSNISNNYQSVDGGVRSNNKLYNVSPSTVYFNSLEDMTVGVQTKDQMKTGWTTRYVKGTDDGRLSVINGGHSGSQSLKVKYPKHGIGTGGSGGTWETELGVHEMELYLSYWVKFDSDFDFKHGGKLPGLGGTFAPFPDGGDQFRIRLMWRENGYVEFYLHDYKVLNLEGEEPYRHPWNLGGQRYFQKGQWHHIEIHVKLNTPGQLDGVLEGWFDGELAFRDNDSNVGVRGVGEEDRKINYLCWHTFFGGGSDEEDENGNIIPAEEYWGPPRDVYAYFDDFIVSRERIGNGVSSSSVSSSSSSSTVTGPAGYTWCADENETYSLPGICDVAYGANGEYNYKHEVTGSITFNNATFGDPIQGVRKSGYYKIISSSSSSSLSSSSSSSTANYATVSVPFTHDGAGEYFWKISTIPSHINSWNTDLLTVNGQDYTNDWQSGSNLPAKQDGYYYIHFKGSVGWSHFEAK